MNLSLHETSDGIAWCNRCNSYFIPERYIQSHPENFIRDYWATSMLNSWIQENSRGHFALNGDIMGFSNIDDALHCMLHHSD